MADELASTVSALKISPHSSSGSGGAGSSAGYQSNRRIDQPHNFIQLARRPDKKVNEAIAPPFTVITNYVRMKMPERTTLNTYNVEFYVSKRGVEEALTKKEKTCPLFWACYQDNQNVFPKNRNAIIYNDVNILYTTEPLNLINGKGEFHVVDRPFDVERGCFPPPRQGDDRPQKPPTRVRVVIKRTPNKVVEFPAASLEQQMELVSFFDLLYTQAFRCPFNSASRSFVTHGSALFHIPEEGDVTVRGIGQGLEVWCGLYAAVKPGLEMGTLMNVDVAASVFYRFNMSYVRFAWEMMSNEPFDENADFSTLSLRMDSARKLDGVVNGTRVKLVIPGQPVRYKKAAGIASYPASQDFFTLDDGKRVSVAEYYAKYKNVILQAPHLQCVKFKPTAKVDRNGRKAQEVHIPMEFCYTTETPERFKGKIDEHLLAKMIRNAARAPFEQMKLLAKFICQTGEQLGQGNHMLTEMKAAISQEFVKVKAKRVPKPHVELAKRGQVVDGKWVPETEVIALEKKGDHQTFYTEQEQGPSRPYVVIEQNRRFLAPLFVFFNANRLRHSGEERERRCKLLLETLQQHGMNLVKQCHIREVELFGDGKDNIYIRTCRELVQEYSQYCKDAAAQAKAKAVSPLIIWVFSSRNQRVYSMIKSVCDVELGVVSQCMLAQTFDKLTGNAITNTTSTNIMLKLIGKTGGLHMKIDKTFHKAWARATMPDDPTLFLGIDVSHPGAEERRNHKQKQATVTRSTAGSTRGGYQGSSTGGPQKLDIRKVHTSEVPHSVYSVVGNIDIDAYKFRASNRVQRLGGERGDHILRQVYERIKDFSKHVGRLPAHIVVYRDGVSETEFRKTLYEEIASIEGALGKLATDEERAMITLTYIVAQKRHKTRLFAQPNDKENTTEPLYNVAPGTLVEDGIVRNDMFDFFLQSHAGETGTSRPTHYTVLRDDWNLSPGFWQNILNVQAYMNVRCTKPHSLPSPLFYAHLSCKRAKYIYDHFKAFDQAYQQLEEELELEDMETRAVTPHENLMEINAMPFV